MSVTKLTLVSLILLSLTACSSGGGSSSNHSNDQAQTNLTQLQAKLANAEQALSQAENEATQALATANSEKQAVQDELNSAKADLTKAQSDLQTANANVKTTQAELAKVQAVQNTTVQELATAKTNLANAEKVRNEAILALATANSEKQAVQNELNSAKADLTKAQSDLQTANANVKAAQAELAKVQADKNATAQELETAKANLAQTETALENKKAVIQEIVNKAGAISEELNGIGGYSWLTFNPERLPSGLSKHPFISISAENMDGIFVGNHYVYLTPDVRVVGRDLTAYWDEEKPEQRSFRIQKIWETPTAELPQAGMATYVGKGFNADNVGTLNYQVNFAEKTGSGSLTNFNNGIADIHLAQGTIDNRQITATASTGGISGKYELGFYGENAASIAGEVYLPKEFEGGIKTNGTTAKKYGDTYETRGTVFGIAGERQ